MTFDRRSILKSLLVDRQDLLLVAGLGASAWDITAAGDSDLNLPLWGGMGGAVMVGLGLALAQPSRPVLVVTGDGEMLMGLGSLATVAVSNPRNLSILVLDNERYGETGMQKTHTSYTTNLVNVAKSCGFSETLELCTEQSMQFFRKRIHKKSELVFGLIKVSDQEEKLVLPPRDGAVLINRFRVKLLGNNANYKN